MKNSLIAIFTFLFIFAFSQETEIIKLNKNIKDKRGLIKSLTVIDSRPDKSIGTIRDAKKSVALKFENENLKQCIENWFLQDNKQTGNTDIILIIEDIKAYLEKDSENEEPISKLRLKMSSFLKRNDKYYFINRFDNIAVVPSQKASFVQEYFSGQISNMLTNFIKNSYTSTVSSSYITESELNNYEEQLTKDYKVLFNGDSLKDGVYMSLKKFISQEPEANFIVTKDRKGQVKRIEYQGERIHEERTFCYIENGKAYRFIRGGYTEMKKDEKGYYIVASRKRLFPEEKIGATTGAMAGGLVGGLIGAALDSGNDPGLVLPFGFPTKTESNVYMDPLTGGYIFTK